MSVVVRGGDIQSNLFFDVAPWIHKVLHTTSFLSLNIDLVEGPVHIGHTVVATTLINKSVLDGWCGLFHVDPSGSPRLSLALTVQSITR